MDGQMIGRMATRRKKEMRECGSSLSRGSSGEGQEVTEEPESLGKASRLMARRRMGEKMQEERL